jgi:hypothetical protein
VRRHLDQRIPPNAEHVLAAREGDQIRLCFRKRHAAFVGVEGVADAHLEQIIHRQLAAQRRPDMARLLCGDGGEQIESEGRRRYRRLDLPVERLLEPDEVIARRHRRDPLG